MYKKLTCFLLCILTIGFIFFNSSKSGSESNYISNSIVNKLIYNEDTIETISNYKSNISDKNDLNYIIRKLAHGIEYFILAVILILLFNNFNINFREKFIYSLFIILIVAILDEFYQMYIPNRTSLVSDVIIDFIGGILGAVITSITIKLKSYLSKVIYDNLR